MAKEAHKPDPNVDYSPLDEAVELIVKHRLNSEFDAVTEVSPFIASRWSDLEDRSFVYNEKRYRSVGSFQEAAGFPVTIMFKTEPA